jgi:hypothetical protein
MPVLWVSGPSCIRATPKTAEARLSRVGPNGAGLFAAAGVLIILMIRRARPDLSATRLGLIGVVLALLLLFAALGLLDAGGHSLEF